MIPSQDTKVRQMAVTELELEQKLFRTVIRTDIGFIFKIGITSEL